MSYFTEVDDYKTYVGHEDDFHFIYNANTGGGQSFLGGKYRDINGDLASPALLNGRTGVFRFAVGSSTERHDVLLEDVSTTYDIKPRAEGDNNMKLSVGGKPTPSLAVSAFLMLPEPCGVKRSVDINTSVLNGNNYWLQSMWLTVDATMDGKAVFTPKDCIVCGGIDKQGQGNARYFAVDFNQRISDIMQLAKNDGLERDVLSCVRYFADIYRGDKTFVYVEASAAIKAVMKLLSSKYPAQYSGTLDPLSFIKKLSHACPSHVKPFASLQRIIYGAPGTGKSHGIEEVVGAFGDTVRTTFHPDSDYASFVGCYKPTMKTVPRTMMAGETVKRVTNGDSALLTEEKIAYSFVAQAFTKAYVRAWRKMAQGADGDVAPQFLVVEEINRGNCAQIFGDLFQLLDRDENGYSKYPIEADADLARHVTRELGGADAQERVPPATEGQGNVSGGNGRIPPEVKSGKRLVLPPNLYIWATMNTSDQSLFPIDSAFKRRWEWKYMPISDAGKGWKIKVANGEMYDWWAFLEKANALVQNATDSEDKKLGYFFCKADASGNITLEQFVGKVIFYLWNDVFKDAGFDGEAFNDGKGGRLLFKDFFNCDGSPSAATVGKFMENLGVAKLPPPADGATASEEETGL